MSSLWARLFRLGLASAPESSAVPRRISPHPSRPAWACNLIRGHGQNNRMPTAKVVPLELEGQLDPNKYVMSFPGLHTIDHRPREGSHLSASFNHLLFTHNHLCRSWEVKMTFNGETKVLTVSEDTPILEAAEKQWPDVPNSCRNGICTTCAARVTAGAESLKVRPSIADEPARVVCLMRKRAWGVCARGRTWLVVIIIIIIVAPCLISTTRPPRSKRSTASRPSSPRRASC